MQILAALAITATDLWLLFNRHMDIHPVVRRAMVIAYVLTNLIGAYTSRNRNHLSREQFQMLERQIQLNQELEEALEEVRTLRGMLPILFPLQGGFVTSRERGNRSMPTSGAIRRRTLLMGFVRNVSSR